jgi:hypothetical protein
MCNFRLKKPVTLAASLMESIAHLVTNDQIVTHLRSVADNLVPGGIYVIEATHPMFVTDKSTNKWTSRKGNMKIESTFGISSDEYDSITQQWMVTTRMKVWNGQGLEAEIENQSPMRWYFPQELKALIDLSNAFEKYWIYGSMYFIPPQPLDESDDSDALVIVLRKKI